MNRLTTRGVREGLGWLEELPGAPQNPEAFLKRLSVALHDVECDDADFIDACKKLNADREYHPTTGHIVTAVREVRVAKAKQAHAVEWKHRELAGPGSAPAFDENFKDKNGLTMTEAMCWVEDLCRRGHEGETGPQQERYADAIAREIREKHRPRYGPDIRAKDSSINSGRLLAKAMNAIPVIQSWDEEEDDVIATYGREARE